MRPNSNASETYPDTITPIQWDVQSALEALAANAASDLPDNLLMTLLAKASDPHAFNLLFEEVFERYYERVGSWCYKVTRNKDRTVDLTQEVFLKAFRSIHTFRGDARLSTWLYAITRNHCLSAIRKMASDPVETGPRVPPGHRDVSAA